MRVNRLAAAIDIIAAGVNAPMAMAAKEKPANHGGNICANSAGKAIFVLKVGEGLIPAAMAI